MLLLRLALAAAVMAASLAPVSAMAVQDAQNQDDSADANAEGVGKDKGKKKPPFLMLPKPLEEVETNALKAMQRTGLFKIKSVKVAYIGESQQRGLVWTLETQRRVTVRRALLLLKNLRSARFYYRSEITKNKLLIHQTVLEYSEVMDVLASQGKSLLPREEIRVWIPLTDVERRRVIGREANLLEFGRIKIGSE